MLLGAVLGTIAVAIVLAAGVAVYGIGAPVDPLGVVGWYFAGLFCFIAIGLCPRLGRPDRPVPPRAIGNLIYVPMFLLGGGGPPRQVMTGVMATLSDVLPLSHIVGGIRLAWLGQTDDPHVLWWPLASAAVAVDRRAVARATSAEWAQRRDGGAEAVDDLGVVELLGHPHRVDDGGGRRRAVADEAEAVDAEEHRPAGVVRVEGGVERHQRRDQHLAGRLRLVVGAERAEDRVRRACASRPRAS